VNFAKLHGAGNDFLVFDGAADGALEARLPALVQRLCDRRTGLGADGVLLVIPDEGRRARLLYWNADGSPAAFCANGTRCAARFIAARWGWTETVLVTGHAAIPATVRSESVALDLPAPEEVRAWRDLPTPSGAVRARYLVVGVPHLVVPVGWEDFWHHSLAPLAPALRHHAELPAGGANVNFCQLRGTELWVRSFERGIEGETLSCGSGDVAGALVAAAERWLDAPVEVRTASRRVLVVTPSGAPPSCPLRLEGPAEWIADGTFADELLAAS
jgi:diaminopimelate epimerase